MEESLLFRIGEASDRGRIIAVLTDVKKIISYTYLRQGFRCSLLEALLQQIKPSFVELLPERFVRNLQQMIERKGGMASLLTEAEFKSYFVELFSKAPVEDALMALVHCLRLPADLFKLQHLTTLFDAVEKYGFGILFEASIAEPGIDGSLFLVYAEIARLLVQIPDLLCNAYGTTTQAVKGLPSGINLDIFLSNHYAYLINAMRDALILADRRVKQGVDVNLKFLAAVLPAIFRGSAKTFQQLVSWLEGWWDTPIWKRLCSRLLTDTSNGILYAEDVVLHVALAVKDGTSILKLLGDQIVRSRFVKRVLFHKLLLMKVFDLKEAVPQKMAACLSEGSRLDANGLGEWSCLYIETVVSVANVWCDSVHLIHSSDEQRRYIDNALLWLIKTASDKIRCAMAGKVNELLVRGVEAHLSAADSHRRFRGMFVAETLTKWLSLGDLHFDYPDEAASYLEDLRNIVDGKVDAGEIEESDDAEEKCPYRDLVDLNKLSISDSCAPVDSDDEEFPSYDIPAAELNLNEEKDPIEGQARVRPPHYIRDCMDDLNEQENYAKFEAAFAVLNPLIRSRALAYDEIASDLARKLIFLTDRFSTERFQERRLEMLTSCLVMSPQLVSVVVTIMFSRSCAMFNRYVILEAISKAATEVSKSDEVPDQGLDVVQKPTETSSVLSDKSWQTIIEERVAAKTKRFGGKVKERKLRKNKFGDVAPLFFYPLTAIEQHREHLDLLHEDYNLLAKILFVLGHVLYCAENCPPTSRMAVTLSEYLIPLQRHQQATIRQAVLFCYSCICLSLSAPVLLQFFPDAVSDWFRYAMCINETDSSIACREMAHSTAEVIASRIRQSKSPSS